MFSRRASLPRTPDRRVIRETIIVHPARVPVVGSPGYYERLERLASLPPPPSGPPSERVVVELPNVRAAHNSRYGKAAVASAPATAPLLGTSPPAAPSVAMALAAEVRVGMAAGRLEPTANPERPTSQPPSASARPIAVIPFAPQSPNLTDTTRKQLDEVAKRITDMRLRQSSFTPGLRGA